MSPNGTAVQHKNCQTDAWKENEQTRNETRQLIGYRGQWYDVSSFKKIHPGGIIIEQFIEQDATYEIDVFHYGNVMKNRKQTKFSNLHSEVHRSLFSEEMLELHKRLKQERYYDNSVWWFVVKGLLVMSVGLLAAILVLTKGGEVPYAMISGLILSLFFQQSGFLMHDFMHSTVTQRKKTDECLGIFFGTVCFGMSSRWWKDEHTLHHALTNVADVKTGFVDPQAIEQVWAQNYKLFPFIPPKMRWFIKIQYYTFLPLCMFVGRFGLLIDSYKDERRSDVIIAIILHWVWMLTLFSQIPSWRCVLIFYFCASVGEGVLHLQLLMNHYSKTFFDKKERHESDYFRCMIECNINISNPWYMDWFHGGLNFHIEHHCFPRLPRNRSREVSLMIKEICKRHGVHYDECSFWTALARTLRHLHNISMLYKSSKVL